MMIITPTVVALPIASSKVRPTVASAPSPVD